ncbi:MAG: integrin alpha [Planctomycetota bacterium]
MFQSLISLTAVSLLTVPLSAQAGAELRRHDGGLFDGHGGTMASLGDINGDTVPDYVIGGDQYLTFSGSTVRVYSGATGGILHSWGPFTNGEAVANAGDVDADGINDIIIGSIWTNSKAGQAKVYSGATGGLLLTFNGASPDDYLGNSVDGAGDVNGDGHDDLLIGAWGESAVLGFSGTAYLYSGLDGSLIRKYEGLIDHGYFGHSVAGLGDVDGDGVPDQAIGELGNDTFGYNTGAAYVYSGATGALLQSWTGVADNSRFAEHMANLGDIDGDGRDDLVVSAMFQQPTGTAHVLSPGTGATLFALTGFDPTEVFSDAIGPGQDVDGDSVPDIMVGSDRYYMSGGYTGMGRVFSGATGEEIRRFSPSSPDGRAGLAVCGLGDLNGDGLGEWAVGAPSENLNGFDSGSVYILDGALLGLHYAVENWGPGQQAAFRVKGGTPLGVARLGYSLTGAGPTPTIYGDVAMTAPISLLATVSLDAQGNGEFLQTLPNGIAGLTVWSQALDLSSGTLSNPHPLLVD